VTLTLTVTVAAHHLVRHVTLPVGDRCLDVLALATQPRPRAQLDFRSYLGLQYRTSVTKGVKITFGQCGATY